MITLVFSNNKLSCVLLFPCPWKPNVVKFSQKRGTGDHKKYMDELRVCKCSESAHVMIILRCVALTSEMVKEKTIETFVIKIHLINL